MLFEVYIRYADVDHGMLGRCETMAFVWHSRQCIGG